MLFSVGLGKNYPNFMFVSLFIYSDMNSFVPQRMQLSEDKKLRVQD